MAENEEIVENKEDDKVEVKHTEEETRAISLGWKPKEEWQGDQNDWVPAKWWLRFGDIEQQKTALESENKHKEKVLNSMKNHYTRVKEDSVKEVLEIIKRQKREAVKNENFERVAELDMQSQILEEGLKNKFAASDKAVNDDVSAPSGPPPEFYSWNRENSWYVLGGKDELTKKADALAIGYYNSDPSTPYQTILETVAGDIKRMFPEKFKKEDPPVSGVDDGGDKEASRSTTTRKSGYKLSEAEKEAARRFGLTEKEYADSQQELNKRKGWQ